MAPGMDSSTRADLIAIGQAYQNMRRRAGSRERGPSPFPPFILLYGSQLQNSCDMPASGRGATETANAQRPTSSSQRSTERPTAQRPREHGPTPGARPLTPDTCVLDAGCSPVPGCCSVTAGQCPHGGNVRAITPLLHSSITPASPTSSPRLRSSPPTQRNNGRCRWPSAVPLVPGQSGVTSASEERERTSPSGSTAVSSFAVSPCAGSRSPFVVSR